MPASVAILKLRSPGVRAAAVGLVAAALALLASNAVAQDAPPQPAPNPAFAPNPPATPQPDPQAAPAPDNPNLIQEIGRFFERGAASVRDHFDGAKKQIDVLNQNATTTGKNIGDTAAEVGKTAAGAVVTPLTSRIISGHERCGVAPNGAPDCVTAAEALCKRNGYTTGKSVDFTSAEQCSPAVLLAGRQNAPVCSTVTFISRAMCQ